MKAVILAAGRGTRMGALTDDTPKPMLPLGNQPKLAFTIRQLPQAITEVVVIVGYLGEQIKTYFGDTYAGKIMTYIEQEDLNGTGGAISLVRDIVGQEKFLVLMGDDLYRTCDLEMLLRYDFALLAFETHDAEQFGLVDVSSDGLLQGVTERPHSKKEGLVNTGAYVLSSAYFACEPVRISQTEYGLPQTLLTLSKDLSVHVVTTDTWQAIGSSKQLQDAQKVIDDYR